MSTEHIHHLSTPSTSSISSMSIDDIHILSISPASSISTTMSIDDIQILSSSPASSTSTSSNTNVSTFSSSSNANVSSSSSSNTNILSSSSSNTNILSSSSNTNFSSSSSNTNFPSSSSSNTNILSSSSSNTNILSSSSSNTNVSASSSSNSLSYASERICYLLKHEKQHYDIIDNKASSAVGSYWSVFGFPAKLNKETGSFERIMGFTSCHKCKKTFVYGPHSGTTHMKQHPCIITDNMKTSTQTPIDKVMLIRKKLSDEQSKVIKDLIVRWICSDIRPFSIIDDDGLRALIQECVRLGMHLFYLISIEYTFLGSIYGNVDVNDILRGRTTISAHVQVVAKSCRERIKELLQEPYKNRCLSISPDFWSDKYKQISYLGVTAVIIDEGFKYYTIDLFCKPFQELEKTAENILIALQNEMKVFGIIDLSTINIVCDKASNFLKAFRDLHPITCYGHRLNNVLKRSFFQHQKQLPTSSAISIEKTSTSDEEEDDDSFYISSKPVKTNKKLNSYTNVMKEQMMTTKLIDTPPAVQLLIKTIVQCKSLAKYIKKAGLNKEIEGAGGIAVQQAIVIRWISLINLLESINASFIQIKVVLVPRKQHQRLSGINQYLVKQTIRLLKPFQAIIKMIQSGSSPTLYLVLPCTLSLQKALKSFDNLLQHVGKYEGQEINDNYNDEQEDEGVSYIRQRISTLLHDMVDLDIRHYCATLLHPNYRSLKGCTNGERVECHNYVREQLIL
ncbi:unnamed protein product, partial [Rotaria sordida]